MRREVTNRTKVNIGKLHCWINGNRGLLKDGYNIFNAPTLDGKNSIIGMVRSWEPFVVLRNVIDDRCCLVVQVLKNDGMVGWLFISSPHKLIELETEADANPPGELEVNY